MSEGAIKTFHKEGFIVIRTLAGEITVALPDADCSERFTMEIEEDNNIATEITFKFDEQ